jgi:hypothetical protein
METRVTAKHDIFFVTLWLTIFTKLKSFTLNSCTKPNLYGWKFWRCIIRYTNDFASTNLDVILINDLLDLLFSSPVAVLGRLFLDCPKHSLSAEISNKFDQQNTAQVVDRLGEDATVLQLSVFGWGHSHAKGQISLFPEQCTFIYTTHYVLF